MTRHAPGLALTLIALLLPVAGRAAEPADQAKGTTPSLGLGCAVARVAGAGSACSELAFFRHEDERRMGEQLGQLLDAPARQKALQAIDAELAEKARKDVPARDCPAARPLCPFTKGALTALKDGLGPEGK